MFIHRIAAISPLDEKFFQTGKFQSSIDNKLYAIESVNAGIPPSALRRMGKAVRISVTAALQIVDESNPINGVVIGTANGGMEDSIKFMNQIMQYNEGMLTPGNFVSSTPNGLASQIAMILKNKDYNITHTHRGLSFENAVIDAQMLLEEHPQNTYLLGAADEISTYNYNIDYLAGWYKKEEVLNTELFNSRTSGSIAGEGTMMMIVNQKEKGALAKIQAVKTLHSNDISEVLDAMKDFLYRNFGNEEVPDVLLTGENGDLRSLPFYEASEKLLAPRATVMRFKHITGEFPTASSLGAWIGIQTLQQQKLQPALVKNKGQNDNTQTILMYNNYQATQHSFILLSHS